MADFLDAEAEESSEGEQEIRPHESRKRKKTRDNEIPRSDDEDEEEDENEEDRQFIMDEDAMSDSEGEVGRSCKNKRKKKCRSGVSDDRLEDDDYDLLEENLGVTIQRKKRFKRLRRMEDQDSDEEREREPEEERDAIANRLFDSDDDVEHKSVASHRPEQLELHREMDSEATDVSDVDDFIVDNDGRPVGDKRKNKRQTESDSALQEAREIFGVDFDYEDCRGDEEEEDEEDDDDEEYIDDDLDVERTRRPKKTTRKNRTRKTMFETYEPIELKRSHFTDLDNEIRNTDIPERMQLRSVPVKPVSVSTNELDLEADWIYRNAFVRPTISIQDAHLSEEAKERARKDPSTIGKIRKALDLMRNQHFEVPFISFYRKEYVNPELNINDLWRVYKWDGKWCELRDRRENLATLLEKIRNRRSNEAERNQEVPTMMKTRTIEQEDIDRARSVETSEELNDVRRNFMLYYGDAINEIRAKNERRKNDDERQPAGNMENENFSSRRDDDIDIADCLNDNNDDNDDILKPAVRSGTYEACRRAGLEAFAARFGLTPQQYGENLRDNYQRHEIEQESTEPSIVATEYLAGRFDTTMKIIDAAKLMVATQLAREPLVRKTIREMYAERAKITVRPTKKGMKEIDENHSIYTMKYLKDKPVRELVGDEYLRLTIAEKDNLVEISFSDRIEGTAIGSDYLEDMKQLYHRDEFSKNVREWNALRAESVEISFVRMILPDIKRELRSTLMAESKEFIQRHCSQRVYNWIRVAPYTCNFGKIASGDGEQEDWEEEDNVEDGELDDEWKTDKGLRVMGLAYVPDQSQAAFACIVTPEGDCIDHLRLPYILKRSRATDDDDGKRTKAADLLALRKFITIRKPHAIAIGGESREAKNLRDDIEQLLVDLQMDEQFPKIPIEICENELAKIYGNSNRGIQEFSDYPVMLRQAISIARRLQDPLVEFAQLCGLDDEILCVNFHHLQNELPRDELLESVHREFVNRVNEVGVDLNVAVKRDGVANLVQFVCGLGSRKAGALVKLLRRTNGKIENRTQLVTLCHMGPKVFINCAGFFKIDTASLGDGTDTYIEALDSTRIHPETYEWARKMAVDALEYDENEDYERETNPADALQEIFRSPEKLKDLDLDAFAEELERQGFGDKRLTLYDIRAELSCGYKDLRAPYESPTPEKLFNILTKETPESFYIGKLITARVSFISRKKPEGEQLDGANPVRNDTTGLWECPFCRKNDFSELSDVWNHFDAGTCPGRANGVRLHLDNGISGYVALKNLSDKRVDDPEERVRIGQVIHCRVIKIEVDRFSIECSSKGSDLADKNNEWRPQRDLFYDTEAEENDLRMSEESKNKQRQAYVKRVIVHPSFKNISYAEAAKLLETMKQGEAIVRPSSKGSDRLTVTWKVTDDVLHHIDVREDGKRFAFSLGKRLFIGNEEFEDLDEIIARHVNPMAAYASELLECHYYKINIDGIEDKAEDLMKQQKKENPNRIPCILSASKKYPGKFLLSYLPRERCMHEYISVSPVGVRYRGRTFARVGELFNWFRKHFRDPPPPVTTPKAPSLASGFFMETSQVGTDNAGNNAFVIPANGATFQYPSSRTPGAPSVSIYGSTCPTTPYTPSGVTPGMTPFTNQTPGQTPYQTPCQTPYETQKTPRYGAATPGNNGTGEFLRPGLPVSATSWGKRSSMPFGSCSGSDNADRRKTFNDGTMENDDSSWRGRGGRGRGRGRGGRGRGRGMGNSFNSSRGGYSGSSRCGSDASSWNESDANNKPGSMRNWNRGGGNGFSASSSAISMGNSTPLWDENESWDDPEPATPTNEPPVSRAPSQAPSVPTNGGRSPLWDESESWDDPEPAAPTNNSSVVRGSSDLSNKPSVSGASSQAPSIPPNGGRSPLWDESESWDDPEPAAPTNNSSVVRGSSNLSNKPPLVRASSQAPSVSTHGGRSPLWDESESWDDPEPAAATNNSSATRGSSNLSNKPPLVRASSQAPSVSTNAGRSPLWDESESWDDPEPASNEPPMVQPQPHRQNVRSSGQRAPPWDNRKSWDRPEPTTPRNKTPLGQPSVRPNVQPIGQRSPLWDESESWDDPEPTTRTNELPVVLPSPRQPSVPKVNQRAPLSESSKPAIPASKPPVGQPIGQRSPLWDESESWDDPEPVASTSKTPVGQPSVQPNVQPSVQPSVQPIGQRSPLWDESESWDDPDPSSTTSKPPVMRPPSQQSSVQSIGQRSSLWTESDQSRSRKPSGQPQKFGNSGRNVPSFAYKTPLADDRDSWDNKRSQAYSARPNESRWNNSRGNRGRFAAQRSSPQNRSFPMKSPNRGARQSAPSVAARPPLYRPNDNWVQPRSSPGESRNSPQTNYIARSKILPAGSRTPLYEPSESWDDTESTSTRGEKSSTTSRQAFEKNPRNNWNRSENERGGPGLRPHIYAPLGNGGAKIESPRSNNTISGSSAVPKINANRSPLYDESESWD